MTASGYMSDVCSDVASRQSAFVLDHKGARSSQLLRLKYDVDDGMVLGRGACGSVLAVRHRHTNELYAMKLIDLTSVPAGSLDDILQELQIQRTLDHPNICKVYESYVDETVGDIVDETAPSTAPSMAPATAPATAPEPSYRRRSVLQMDYADDADVAAAPASAPGPAA